MPIIPILINAARAGGMMFARFSQATAAATAAAASRATAYAGRYISANIPTFIQKGFEFLRGFQSTSSTDAIKSGLKYLQKSKFSITSSSTISGDIVSQKIETYLGNRIASMRSVNPKSAISKITNQKNFSPKLFAGSSGMGFDDFAEGLEKFSESIETIISTEGSASAENMRRKLMMYPPERNDSLYRRTFDLQQGWEIAFVSFNANDTFSGDVMFAPSQNTTSVSFSNNVPYTKWVQRRATQTWVHRGRWNTVEDVTEQESPEFLSRIEQIIKSIIT
jgi:hypothetical protein